MMNNLLNKNSLIGALIILLLITSWWGQSETGANKQLTRDKKTTEAQLATVKAEVATTRQTLQEKTAALADGEEKLSEAKAKIQRLENDLSTKKVALTALDKEEKVLFKKINELEHALNNTKAQQAQADSEQQKNIQKTVAAHKEALAQLKKAEARIAQLEKELTELNAQSEAWIAKLKTQTEARTSQLEKQAETQIAQLKAHYEAQTAQLKTQAKTQIARLKKKQAELKAQAEDKIAQLEKKQLEVTTEAESLQAQVIGFEKVVEERNTALAGIDRDLQDCKVNTKVLLSKITEQENTQQGMKEKIHLMVQDLSEEAAHKKTAPVQKKQPVQTK